MYILILSLLIHTSLQRRDQFWQEEAYGAEKAYDSVSYIKSDLCRTSLWISGREEEPVSEGWNNEEDGQKGIGVSSLRVSKILESYFRGLESQNDHS